MSKRDAELTIGADASQVERAAAVAVDAWRNAGASITESFSRAARNIAASLSEVALAQGKVNFASQHSQVRDFESATAHLAVSMGRDLEQVRGQMEATGKDIGKRPQEIAAWTAEVGKLTYSFSGASESIRGMAAISAQTGRSIDDYRGLAVVLGQIGVTGKQTGEAMGVLAAQAANLGTQGGVAALADQFEAAGDAVSRFADRGLEGFKHMSAFLGTLTKDMDAVTARRVGDQALGALAADPRGWERFIGRHILDERGKIEDPSKVFQDIYAKASKTYHGETLRNAMINNFGPELGMAILNGGKTGDFGKAGAIAGLSPSAQPEGDLRRYIETDAGQRDVANSTLAESARSLMGSSTTLGRAADALQQFASHNPITSTIGASVAGGAIQAAISTALSAVSGGGVGGPGVGAVGEAASGMGKFGGALAAVIPELALATGGILAFGIAANELFKWMVQSGLKPDPRADYRKHLVAREEIEDERAREIAAATPEEDVRRAAQAKFKVSQRAEQDPHLQELLRKRESGNASESDIRELAAASFKIAGSLKDIKAQVTIVDKTAAGVAQVEQAAQSAAAGSQR